MQKSYLLPETRSRILVSAQTTLSTPYLVGQTLGQDYRLTGRDPSRGGIGKILNAKKPRLIQTARTSTFPNAVPASTAKTLINP